MMRIVFYWIVILSTLLTYTLSLYWPNAIYFFFIIIPYALLCLYDIYSKHNVLYIYPVIGHLRYMFEFIRPEIQQYFIATNHSGRPFNRETRNFIYQRSKNVVDTLPFGTQYDIHKMGYQYAYHSLIPVEVSENTMRILIGGANCSRPYNASRLNISAMSFGSISSTAVLAMNRGAKLGNFAQNTGEGGISPYHLQEGGDLIWEVASAYFGCRDKDGNFDPKEFSEKARLDVVKMIELKLSQGAKPSHGGILPGIKVNQEIASTRGIPVGVDCISPATHATFQTPEGLLAFIQQLRELSDGKPVGFKMCIGNRTEFMSICKAMIKTKLLPDFITIDGAEGGTGAAPVEFSNRLGTPLNEALSFVQNCLVGCGLRDKITLIGSGKVASGFDLLTKMSLGADACNVARAMMFAVGCIQALKCNTNHCPTGVTTQDPRRIKAIDPLEKSIRVKNYHQATLQSFREIMGAIGIDDPRKLTPNHIQSRISDDHVQSYGELYSQLKVGELLGNNIHPDYADDWGKANAESF